METEKQQQLQQYRKTYYLAHRDVIRAHTKLYSQTHKDKVKEWRKVYYDTHREQIKIYQREYYRRHLTPPPPEVDPDTRVSYVDRLETGHP